MSTPTRPYETTAVPTRARDLLLLAVAYGWSAALLHAADSEGHPYLEIRARRDTTPYDVRATWHTCNTGSYRLTAARIGAGMAARRATLTAVRNTLIAAGGTDA